MAVFRSLRPPRRRATAVIARSSRSSPSASSAAALYRTETLPRGTLRVHLRPIEASAIQAEGVLNGRSFFEQLRAEMHLEPSRCIDVIVCR